MSKFTKYLVVDLGNTDLKFGVYTESLILTGRGWDALLQFVEHDHVHFSLVSNVASSDHEARLKKLLPDILFLKNIKHIPLNNQYETPHTLGQDRLANAVAISHLTRSGAALCIDVGTCLKFDFIDEQQAYLGGSIAPGLHMRFRALHEYTANLPLIETWENPKLFGTDTQSSLISGVIEGMSNEINATILRYQEHYKKLTIFLTGGDHIHFENAIKSRIFADPNLTLHGLKIILEANV